MSRASQWQLWDVEGRRLLVISPDERNAAWPTVLVAQVTTMPVTIPAPAMVDLGGAGHAWADQLTTITHVRLTAGDHAGTVTDPATLSQVRDALRTALDLH